MPPLRRTRYLPARSISIVAATVDGCAATASGSAVISPLRAVAIPEEHPNIGRAKRLPASAVN
jgi:hypothetical protein